MKKVFLTFGDGGENFVAARKRIAAEARETGVFDEVRDCDWSDCTDETKASPLRQYKRGCGYWVWKPDLILKELKGLEDGDVLVWSDAGNTIYRARRQWRMIFKRLETVDLILRRISSCGFHWQRKELHEAFACSVNPLPMLRMCFNFEGSTLVMKRTPFTLDFVTQWRTFMLEHPEWVRDVGLSESDEGQLPTFVENRHDQSVLSLLVYRHLSHPETKNKILSLWEFHQGAWLLGDPAIMITRNRGGEAIRLSPKQRMIRLIYRVLWRFQLMLERHGLQICWAKFRHS